MGYELAAIPAPTFGKKASDDEFFDMPQFEIADRVRSSQFGPGEIIDIDGLAVTVQFDSGSRKKLNVEYARLEKID